MDLVFARKELLDVALDEAILGSNFESAWRDHLRPLAKRALITAGVDNRVPFILASDGGLNSDLSALFRAFSGQTSGRSTMASYAQHAMRLVRHLFEKGIDIASVKPSDLSNYRRLRTGSGIDPISWNSEASALKSFFDAAVLLRIRPDNPSTFPTLVWYNKGARVEPKAPDFITLTEFERFRDEGLSFGRYGLRNAAFANLLITTGMRLDEGNEYKIDWLPSLDVVRASSSQSVLHRITADAAKGHRSRKVRIPRGTFDSMRMYSELLREDQVAEAIRKGKYLEDPKALWLNQEGLPMGEVGWGDVFRRATKRTGIKATPKTLRHTNAVYLLSRLLKNMLSSVSQAKRESQMLKGASTEKIYQSIFGDPLRKVQKHLGHKFYETTFVYLDVLGSHQGINDAELAVFDQVIGTEEDYSDVAF